MSDHWSYLISVLLGYFAIMNPVANTAIFLAMTDGMNALEQRQIAIRSTLLAFGIVTLFCLLGKVIFNLFGITLPAFRITGGILVFLIGSHMLSGNPSEVHTPTDEDNEKSRDARLDIAITPLAMPILAGPGTIASAMNFSAGKGYFATAMSITGIGLICALTCFMFIFGETFVRFIGDSAIKVISRMMGLILAVIGTQMVIVGIHGAMQLSF